VEGDIVLSHKLIIADIFRVLPPLLPLVAVVRGDAYIPNRSVEPYVEDLKKARAFFHGNCLKLGILPAGKAEYLSINESSDIKGMREIAIWEKMNGTEWDWTIMVFFLNIPLIMAPEW